MSIMQSDETADMVEVDTRTPLLWADGILRRLAAHARSGLPDCYQPATQFWFDFWPDLPWDSSRDAVVRAMMAHPDYDAVAERFEARTGLNLRAELRAGLEAL